MDPWNIEYESPVSASRMFKAAILDWHNLGPKLAPEILHMSGTEVVEGDDSRAGRIRQFSFTSAMPHLNDIKERLDFVDHDNLECKASFVDGGHLGKKVASLTVQYKIVPKSNGGCVCKVITSAEPLPGIIANEGAAEWAKDMFSKHYEVAENYQSKHFKLAENYLLANPNAYA